MKGSAEMTLDKGKINDTYTVLAMNGLPAETEKRLEALGMTVGTEIAVLNNKSKGTLIIKVRGTRFALGQGISRSIEVV